MVSRASGHQWTVRQGLLATRAAMRLGLLCSALVTVRGCNTYGDYCDMAEHPHVSQPAEGKFP